MPSDLSASSPTPDNQGVPAPHTLGQDDGAADKLERAKKRLDRALNTLEHRVALHSDRLRQTNASDVEHLRQHAQQVEQEKRFLVEQLQRLDAYLAQLEADLQTPPALPNVSKLAPGQVPGGA